ncbi:hypothetical protein ABWL39_14485 [Chitinivorax sp. PXF-14]|uniref:hypothetical protein n=1 Tax=Chitinivorax sp. PXF-14 TaxID=3230488 RepID=UPI003466A55D
MRFFVRLVLGSKRGGGRPLVGAGRCWLRLAAGFHAPLRAAVLDQELRHLARLAKKDGGIIPEGSPSSWLNGVPRE